MMNKLIKKVFRFSLVITFAVNAQSVNGVVARNLANKWLEEVGGVFDTENRTLGEVADVLKNNKRETLAFVFSLEPKGFVIVSADKRITPVVGFSFESDYIADDDFFWRWFTREDLSSRFDAINNRAADISVLKRNEEKWTKLLERGALEKKYDVIGPFVQSNWSQGYVNGELVFNYYTPNHWSAGCVATAMAQVLNYYKWPLNGTGYHSYYENNAGTISVDYGETWYDWENTLDDYENNVFTLPQQKAAGLLTFHAAVSVNMDFGSQGSEASTSDIPYALHSYFRHSGHYKSVTSSGFWTQLKNNMLDFRPAVLSIKRPDGFGHAAVVDGYFDMNNYYHLNPGWGGNYDGWYDISGDWNMSGYTIVVGAVKGIVPSPMINDIVRVSELAFDLSWSTSRYQYADYYELQQSRNYGGPWTTLDNEIADTVYRVNVSEIGKYYYRVRARRDDIWWDWSKVKGVQLGSDRSVTFRVALQNGDVLDDGENFVVRGNIPPLSGNANSEPFLGPDSQGVYSLTLDFDFDYVGDTIIYRFFIDSLGTLIPETQNRYYALTAEASQILPIAYFNEFPDGVNDGQTVPKKFELYQNYPNPFNPTTTISYSLPLKNGVETSRQVVTVSLQVFNSIGQKVATLVNKEQAAGNFTVQFDARDLPSGIYFYTLRAGEFTATKKMILLK